MNEPGIDSARGQIPFGREDEETLKSVAGWATAVAVISLASSAAGAAIGFAQQGLQGLTGSAISMVVSVLLAVFLLQAAASLRRVSARPAGTDPVDTLYFVDGLRKLRNYFMTTGIIVIVALSLVALAVLAALTCGLLLR